MFRGTCKKRRGYKIKLCRTPLCTSTLARLQSTQKERTDLCRTWTTLLQLSIHTGTKRRREHTDRPDKFYDTFKPFIQQQRQGININTSVKTKENNVEKNQNEAAETLASYFKNAALNIGGGHVSRLTEDHHSEHDSVKSIREVYEENDFDFKLLTPNEVQRAGHLKTSI